jgi:hypothetical protein
LIRSKGGAWNGSVLGSSGRLAAVSLRRARNRARCKQEQGDRRRLDSQQVFHHSISFEFQRAGSRARTAGGVWEWTGIVSQIGAVFNGGVPLDSPPQPMW